MGRPRGNESSDPATCSDRERAFVDAFLGEARGNQKRAAQLAGYGGGKNGHAWSIRAAELLDRARVRALIEQRRAEIAELERLAAERARADKVERLVRDRAETLLGGVLTAHQLQQFWSGVVMGEITGFDGAQRIQAARDLAKSIGLFVHENETAPTPIAQPGDDAPRVHVNLVMINNGRGPEPTVIALPPGAERKS